MNNKFEGYRCSVCAQEYDRAEVTYVCPVDGGNLDVINDFSDLVGKPAADLILEREQSMWRYLPLLPVDDPGGKQTPIHAVGMTPIFSPQSLKDSVGLQRLLIKDESRNPTASFKDRASALVVARAREIGAEIVVTASTGNAGAALAGMAAALNHKAVIFAPKNAPSAKITQLLIYGATVMLVDGNYDAAFDLSVKASTEFGWYCRNTGYNPFTVEGKKTAAFEIWESLLKGKEIDRSLCVFVSVGDGNIISGIHKGFKDLQALGMIDTLPRLFGIQSEGSSAIADAYESGTEQINPVAAATMADSIAVDYPRDGLRALRAARQTNGAYIKVADQDILAAIKTLGNAGIFAEPAGAAAYAGMLRALHDQVITADDPVLVINTGNGLKDVHAAMEAAGNATIIEPTLSALKKAMSI